MLNIGDPAPDFTLPNQDGEPRSLADFRGSTVVLYFYPKDMTSGCTKEACDLRDAFAAKRIPNDVVVFGVSADSPASHRKFIAKERIPFDLLSDEDRSVIRAYGAWVEKSMYGRKYMGIDRSTFVIGLDGKIAAVYRKVKVPGHVDAVLAALG